MFLSSAIKIRIEQLCKERNITINKLCRPNTNLTILTIMRICRGLNIISDFFNSSLFNIDTLDDD